MKQLYFRNGNGKTITVEVTDEVATAYRESLREEWRGNAKEHYHIVSLDAAMVAGHDFADERECIDEIILLEEEMVAQKEVLGKLTEALSSLTPLQRATLHKVYVLHMSQVAIAREEGVAKQIISKRLIRIHTRLKKILEKL